MTALSTLCFNPAQAEDLLQLWKIVEQTDAKYQGTRHKYLADQELSVISRADLLPEVTFQYEYKGTDQTFKDSDNDIFDSGLDKFPTDTDGVTLTQSVFDYSRWQRSEGGKVSTDLAQVDKVAA